MKPLARVLSVVFAGSLLAGSYHLGQRNGVESVQQQYAPLQQLASRPAAEGFLDHQQYTVRLGAVDENAALYLQRNADGSLLPVNAETPRFLEVYQRNPVLMRSALAVVEKIP